MPVGLSATDVLPMTLQVREPEASRRRGHAGTGGGWEGAESAPPDAGVGAGGPRTLRAHWRQSLSERSPRDVGGVCRDKRGGFHLRCRDRRGGFHLQCCFWSCPFCHMP